MGLSAHLAGVQNGMLLILLGLVWPEVLVFFGLGCGSLAILVATALTLYGLGGGRTSGREV